MKRLIILLLASLILSACTSKDTTESKEDSKKSQEKEVTNETMKPETEEQQKEDVTTTAPEKEQANPDGGEKQQPTEQKEEEKQVDSNQPLTHGQAEELVKKHLNLQGNPNVHVKYDHDAENGDYIIQVYEVIIDDPKTGQGHTNTWGWFGVNKTTKEVYDAMN